MLGELLASEKGNSQIDFSTYTKGIYFLKIDKVKFKRKVVPGDTLILKVDLLEPIRRGIALVFAEIFVGDQMVMEGELMAQIFKPKQDD